MYEFTTEQTAFLNSSGKVVLHACPGSGKTTIVAEKVVDYLKGWDKSHKGIAVLSFTNVASEEIQHRVKEMLPHMNNINQPHFLGTLDSFINNYIFLRFGYLLLPSHKRPSVIMNDIAKTYGYWRGECYQRGCVNNIEQFKWDDNRRLTKNDEIIMCTGTRKFKAPCIEFKEMLLKKGLFYQDEIPGLSVLLLKKYPEIAKCISERFPIIILDEAQDTSVEQMKILDLLCEAGLESMYIVGDPDQSIYEWRTANPESFIEKMQDGHWKTYELSENFRSSQLICDATYVFSDMYKEKGPNKASGDSANHTQKPVLCVYDSGIDADVIISKFKDLCLSNNIEVSPENVAIVKRGKIHTNTVKDVWKTAETELLAKASYEWLCGDRKKAYNFCERAIFQLTVKSNADDILYIEEEVSKIMQYELWKVIVTDILVNLPSADIGCGLWATTIQSVISRILSENDIKLIDNMPILDAIKIKSRDATNPNFKLIPVKDFFQKKIQTEYTFSSVHGVKGETFDALMLLVENIRGGNTLTPSFLAKGNTNSELMRIAYVAMTRPRKLLMVAMPKSNANLDLRFPKEKWEYLEM